MKDNAPALIYHRVSGLRAAVMFNHNAIRNPRAEVIHGESLSLISEIFTYNSSYH